MNYFRTISSVIMKLDLHQPVDELLAKIADELDDFVKDPSFFSLPLETICAILSKRENITILHTADEILKGCSLKHGKKSVILLQYLNCGAIGYNSACLLCRHISECPIISELLNAFPNKQNVSQAEKVSRRRSLTIKTSPFKQKKRESEITIQSEDINALKRQNADIITELEDFIGKIEDEPQVPLTRSTKRLTKQKSDSSVYQAFGINENDIFQAIVDDDIKTVKRIIATNKAEVNKRNSDNNYPIHVAAKKRRIEIVKLLVENGADVNQKGFSFLSPLHFAADFNSPDIITYLLKKGANIEVKSGWVHLLLLF